MRRRLSFWASYLLSALLLGPSACGAPDLNVTVGGYAPETRWLDVILWQFSESSIRQQSPSSRQLIDISAAEPGSFYTIGYGNLNRAAAYAIFVAAFKDDGKGKPCLINTAAGFQDPGWSLIADNLVPFFGATAPPSSACLQPVNASASWPTEMPFIADVSLATTAFDGKDPPNIPSLSIHGWNFMIDDTVSAVFEPPSPPPTVKSKVLSPLEIAWGVERVATARLTVQDLTVERGDQSARHTVTIGVEIPNLF